MKSTTSNVQIDESPIIKQVIADYPFQEGETLSNDETIILKSYFKCAKNKDIDKVLLTQYYLDKIDKLDVDEWTKYRCNPCLSLIRDALMVSTCDKTAAGNSAIDGKAEIQKILNNAPQMLKAKGLDDLGVKEVMSGLYSSLA